MSALQPHEYDLETRACAGGCGIAFRTLPSSPHVLARPDCEVICKGGKRTFEERKRRIVIAEAESSWKITTIYKGVSTHRTNEEVRLTKLAEEKSVPKWKRDFEAVMAAAKKNGKGEKDKILRAAGVAEGQWYTALQMAKKEDLHGTAKLYTQAFKRKLRGYEGDTAESVVSEPEEHNEIAAEPEEPENPAGLNYRVTGEAAPPSMGEAVGSCYDWLVQLEPEQRARAYKALGLLLDID